MSEGRNPLVCSPACLLASCQLRNFPREFTEKCFAIFDQSSCAIYLTWYRSLLFFREFSSIIPFMVWLWDSSQIKGRGYIFKSTIVGKRSAEVMFFFNWKLNIPCFIFLIWAEQFWIWFSRKQKNVKISIVFLKLSLFYLLYDFRILVQIYKSIIQFD